jgi:hypothetical protein
MDTYGHLFEGSDRDSAEEMERLFGAEPARPASSPCPDQAGLLTKLPTKTQKLA